MFKNETVRVVRIPKFRNIRICLAYIFENVMMNLLDGIFVSKYSLLGIY